MEQRLTVITLGVSDLGRARTFYSGTLGWTPFTDNTDVIFYDLGSCVLALYGHADLAADMTIPMPDAPLAAYHGFALAHNMRSIAEIDAFFERLTASGVKILKPPQPTSWGGYAGYFADPDGHAWEIAYNPHWSIAADGRLDIKKF